MQTPPVPVVRNRGRQDQRRGRDSNPRYGFDPVKRFSKPSPSAARPPLLRGVDGASYRWSGNASNQQCCGNSLNRRLEMENQSPRRFCPLHPLLHRVLHRSTTSSGTVCKTRWITGTGHCERIRSARRMCVYFPSLSSAAKAVGEIGERSRTQSPAS